MALSAELSLDCGKTMEPIRTKRKFTRRLREDGEWEYKCRRCDKHKKSSNFRSHKGMQWGIDTTCRSCRSIYESLRYKERNQKAATERYRKFKRREKEANKVWRGEKPTPTRCRMVKEVKCTPELQKAALRLNKTLEDASHSLYTFDIEPKTLAKIESGQCMVRLETAEKIAAILMEPNLLDAFMPNWNQAGDKGCKVCGTNIHPHQGKGMCRLCYHRDYYGAPQTIMRAGERWARYFDQCVMCGTREKKHAGRGHCSTCFHILKGETQRPPVDSWKKQCIVCLEIFDCSFVKKIYCSHSCKTAAYLYKATGKVPSPRQTKCGHCSGPLPPGSTRRKKYCTLKCKNNATNKRNSQKLRREG